MPELRSQYVSSGQCPLCDDAVVLYEMEIPLNEEEGVVYEDDQVEEEENVDEEDVKESEEE